ncbi:hypothetical protein AB0D42_35575 [Streptomyces sp. NPDC048304]|uniref:hypothetical protein n=1 Tax=Streptomyces sp. NPDC048304 TaxID=3154820 RepID=UPI0033C4F197
MTAEADARRWAGRSVLVPASGLGASFASETDHFFGPDGSVAVYLMEDEVPGHNPEGHRGVGRHVPQLS